MIKMFPMTTNVMGTKMGNAGGHKHIDIQNFSQNDEYQG